MIKQRLTSSEYFKLLKKQRKKNKFHAQRSKCAKGHNHGSKGEAGCCNYLGLLERAAEIKDVKTQVRVRLILGPKAHWDCIPDFEFYDMRIKEVVYGEYKGNEKIGRWPQTRKYWRQCGTGRIRVFKGVFPRIKMVEEIIPEGWGSWKENQTGADT